MMMTLKLITDDKNIYKSLNGAIKLDEMILVNDVKLLEVKNGSVYIQYNTDDEFSFSTDIAFSVE